MTNPHKKTDLYLGELEILKYFVDNISYDKKTEVVGDLEQGYWAYTLTGYVNNKDNVITGHGQSGLTKKMLQLRSGIKDADYIIYFNRTNRYKILKDEIHERGTTIFENEYGGIVKCNN